MAGETRAKAVSIAEKFGYTQDDAEDIAQDVMLKLWSLHEHLSNEAHLKASTVITTKRVCIDRWRTAHQHAEIAVRVISDFDIRLFSSFRLTSSIVQIKSATWNNL